jgi:hypothetical protein
MPLLGFLAMLASNGSTGTMHAGSSSRPPSGEGGVPRRMACSMVHAGRVWYRVQCLKNGRAVFDAAPPYK